tara:strand:- start:678 stop:860 length:183 start_codon:yes stop_codon:yes gene_type:complete
MLKIKSKHQPTDEEYEAWMNYMTTQCYGCATQRDKCEHDDIDWKEYQCGNDEHPEWWEEV